MSVDKVFEDPYKSDWDFSSFKKFVENILMYSSNWMAFVLIDLSNFSFEVLIILVPES